MEAETAAHLVNPYLGCYLDKKNISFLRAKNAYYSRKSHNTEHKNQNESILVKKSIWHRTRTYRKVFPFYCQPGCTTQQIGIHIRRHTGITWILLNCCRRHTWLLEVSNGVDNNYGYCFFLQTNTLAFRNSIVSIFRNYEVLTIHDTIIWSQVHYILNCSTCLFNFFLVIVYLF